MTAEQYVLRHCQHLPIALHLDLARAFRAGQQNPTKQNTMSDPTLPEHPSYVHKVCFIENTDTNSRYENGDYYIVRQSPTILYGIRTIGGIYETHNIKSFPLVGSQTYKVIEVNEVDIGYIDVLRDTRKEACAELGKDKPHWIPSVYHACIKNCDTIIKHYETTQINKAAAPTDGRDAGAVHARCYVDKIRITIPGTLKNLVDVRWI